MRARGLKPALFTNEILGAADPLLTILFVGLWCLADREGRLEDRPVRIRAEVFPYRPQLDAEAAITWLEQRGFVRRYVVDGLKIIEVIAFSDHQHPHKNEVASVLPAWDKAGATKVRRKTGQGTKRDAPRPDASPPLDDALGLTPSSLTPDSGLLTPDSPLLTPEGVNPVALGMWLEYRQADKKPIKPHSLAALQKKFVKLGDDAAQLAAVENSIGNSYQGLYAETYTNGSGHHAPHRKPKTLAELEAQEERDNAKH